MILDVIVIVRVSSSETKRAAGIVSGYSKNTYYFGGVHGAQFRPLPFSPKRVWFLCLGDG